MSEDKKGFWASVPGILTGIAAVLTAITGLYVAVWEKNSKPSQDKHIELPLPKPIPKIVIHPKELPQNPIQPLKDIFNLTAVIDDPDGYSNVRSMRTRTSSIVARINKNERFHTYLQKDNWWQVKTADGKLGYMHVSKIKMVSE
jgi:uncharacterized protein YgiM (DUF1202 family)